MVLGGRPPGRVGHCQGAFLFNILILFSSEYESCIIMNCRCGWWTWLRPDFTKEECEAFFLIVDHFAVSSFWIIISGRVCISADFFCRHFPGGRRWFGLASVNLRNGESQDSLLKRFRKKVVKSGVLSTVRRKRWFVSKSEQRRMEKKKAIRRIKRRTFTRETE